MYIEPKNVELPPGKYQKLDKQTKLKPDDYVRRLTYIGFSPSSDYIDYSSINSMNWQLVKTMLPAWVGKTIEQYETFGGQNSQYSPSPFEAMRRIP